MASILGPWGNPIQLGILAANAPMEQRYEYFRTLKQWQEVEISTGIRQIGFFPPHPEYNDLMRKYAGPLLALVAALMRDIPESGPYLAQQCNHMLEYMKTWPPEISLFTALWMLYIAASSKLAGDEF